MLDKRFENIRNETILKEFEYRFNKSHADRIDLISDSKLTVKNEIIRWAPDGSFNFWFGIARADVEILGEQPKPRTITYTFYYTRIIISYIIFLCFYIIAMTYLKINIREFIATTKIFLPTITLMFLLPLLILLIRHKTVFNGIIRNIRNRRQ